MMEGLRNSEEHPEADLETMQQKVHDDLLGIFPDADPVFLKTFAVENHTNPEGIKDFVTSHLGKRGYPTKAEYLKRVKLEDQERLCTSDFDVEGFLEIFPDPVDHFENPERSCVYSSSALDFLKSNFSNEIAEINAMYEEQKYNVSLTANKLPTVDTDTETLGRHPQPLAESISMTHEFAFIRNRSKLLEFADEKKEKDRREFNELKGKNALMQCECCFNEECMPSKCSACSEAHIFCNTCIQEGTEVVLGQGQTDFPCFVECEGEFRLSLLEKVLKPKTFSILIGKRQEAEVKAARLEGLVACSFCHYAAIPPPEDKVLKCLNPACMKESCRICKGLNHVPLRCNEVANGHEDQAQHYIEEKMTRALLRCCYACKKPYVKESGCNAISCVCGAMMCYICGTPITNHSHFGSNSCQQTTNDLVLNAQSVREAATAAYQETLAINPNLQINIGALMP